MTALKTLYAKLDRLWPVAIKLRDKRCMICGSTYNLESHHSIVNRSAKATRWHLLNGISCCRICHTGIHDGIAVANLQLAIDRIASEDQQAEIFRLGHAPFKPWLQWAESHIDYLERFIKLQGDK
jgi:hypothetical protein